MRIAYDFWIIITAFFIFFSWKDYFYKKPIALSQVVWITSIGIYVSYLIIKKII
jgi:hypothetical protein